MFDVWYLFRVMLVVCVLLECFDGNMDCVMLCFVVFLFFVLLFWFYLVGI